MAGQSEMAAQPISAPISPMASFEISEGESSRLPRVIVVFDANKQVKVYKLKVRLDGSLSISETRHTTVPQSGKPVMLVLHPQLLFSRQGRFMPKDSRSLRSLARDLFPFEPEASSYAAFQAESGKPVFYALPDAQLNELLAAGQISRNRLRAVIVSPDDETAMLDVIKQRLETGVVCDLLKSAYKISNPAWTVMIVLLVVLFLGIFAASGAYHAILQERVEHRNDILDVLEDRVGPTAQKYENIRLMQKTLEEFARFSDPQYMRTMSLLMNLLNSAPKDVAIQTIEFQKGRVLLTGLYNEPQAWFNIVGVHPQTLDIKDLPKVDLFEAEFLVE